MISITKINVGLGITFLKTTKITDAQSSQSYVFLIKFEVVIMHCLCKINCNYIFLIERNIHNTYISYPFLYILHLLVSIRNNATTD